eukprot:11825569-Ditylum_brightwellii.AAC.1
MGGYVMREALMLMHPHVSTPSMRRTVVSFLESRQFLMPQLLKEEEAEMEIKHAKKQGSSAWLAQQVDKDVLFEGDDVKKWD